MTRIGRTLQAALGVTALALLTVAAVVLYTAVIPSSTYPRYQAPEHHCTGTR